MIFSGNRLILLVFMIHQSLTINLAETFVVNTKLHEMELLHILHNVVS